MRNFKIFGSKLGNRILIGGVLLGLVPIVSILLGSILSSLSDGCSWTGSTLDCRILGINLGGLNDLLFTLAWSFLVVFPVAGVIIVIGVIVNVVHSSGQLSGEAGTPRATRTKVITALIIATILTFGFYYIEHF